MVTEERTIQRMLMDLHDKRWSDLTIAGEVGVKRGTVWAWRQGLQAPSAPKLMRQALEGLLARP